MYRNDDSSTKAARARLPDAGDPPPVKALRALEAGCGMGDPATDAAVRECCGERRALAEAFARHVAKQQAQAQQAPGSGGGSAS